MVRQIEVIPLDALAAFSAAYETAPVIASSVIHRSIEPRFDPAVFLDAQPFENSATDATGKIVGLANALDEVLAYSVDGGTVLSMPELIAARLLAAKDHLLWQNGYDVLTEENIGPNTEKRFYPGSKQLLVVIHGGGLLTPERIRTACGVGLVDGSARYDGEEFDTLLRGELPDGTHLPMYDLEAVTAGIPDAPRRFGVVLPYEVAQGSVSGMCEKDEFLIHPLSIARNGGRDGLEAYFKKSSSERKLGCWHPFIGRDASTSQGRLLYLSNIHSGLLGVSNLDYLGRFVGVSAGGARR